MRLATPEKIRTLQRKLHLKAKAEPAFRFYLLAGKIAPLPGRRARRLPRKLADYTSDRRLTEAGVTQTAA